MRFIALIAAVSMLLVSPPEKATGADLDKLKILYVGDPETPRAKQFEGFISKNVAEIKVVSRLSFKPAQAERFDVVLLDWPQSESVRDDWKQSRSPLGDRTAWKKPTVLLGSAGLNLAVVWKVRGGSG